ncbi:MAG: sel1 repeat family protein [archaeon]|nr:sel1 repeat family protein [archaeon]
MSKWDDKIKKRYVKAAREENPAFYYSLAMRIWDGYDMVKDPAEVIKYLRLGVEVDEPNALCTLAYCYMDSFGVERNYDEADRLLRRAARCGLPHILYEISRHYRNFPLCPDHKQKSLKYLKKAAEAGSAPALSDLASMYYRGDGVRRSCSKAFECWVRCNEIHDNWHMRYLIAVAYETGVGVGRSLETAARMYIELADEGVSGACYKAGICYRDGIGVERCPEKAERYLAKGSMSHHQWLVEDGISRVGHISYSASLP